MKTYRFTVITCVFSVLATAAAASLLPIMFVPLMDLYDLSFGHLGLLVAVYSLSALAASLCFSRLPDKYGLRAPLMTALTVIASGFLLLNLSPMIFSKNILTGLILASVVYGGAVGFLETMLSPVINSLPFKNKHRAMSLFHSAFAWCTVIAVAVTSVSIFFLPAESWNYIPLFWIIVPLICIALWVKAPIIRPPVDVSTDGPRILLKNKVFYLSVFAVVAAVASEIIISSGASAFIEKGLDVPKLIGDMMGPCMFSLAFGLGRSLYGLFGERLNIRTLMVWGSLACLILYLTAALVPVTAVGIIALALCGFAVSLLFPGMFTTSSARFPNAGVWLFAMITVAGKSGAAGGSALFGYLGGAFDVPALASFADGLGLTPTQLALRISLLCCAVFPLISLILQIILRRREKREQAVK